MCKRWEKFSKFLEDMGERPDGNYTIERINNDLGYSPSNCRWAYYKEQYRNTRQTFMVTAFGETLTLGEWSQRIGIKAHTLSCRIKRGWPIERALNEKLHEKPCSKSKTA